jgi:hypothetical protein
LVETSYVRDQWTRVSTSVALMHSADASPLDRAAAFQALREIVLNSVVSEHSKRNYAKALDQVFALCEKRKQPLFRALLVEYRSATPAKRSFLIAAPARA